VKTERNLKIEVERFLALGSDEIVSMRFCLGIRPGRVDGVEEGKRRHGWVVGMMFGGARHENLRTDSVLAGK
jgi:hypothetical protein